MLLRHKIELETVILMILAACVSSFFVWYFHQNPLQGAYIVTPVTQELNQPTITPTAEPTPQIEKTSQPSPDGKELFSMQVTHHGDQTLTYLFTATDSDGSNEREIYATTSAELKLSIPFNTWSPDDKYVFIQKGSSDALVFPASGDPITADQPYLDVADDFQAKLPDVTISEITGWAAPELLIINSQLQDSTQGPSYWYKVPSGGITQLSTKF